MSNSKNESRPAPAPVQVPEGMVLVPVEPTPQMLAAVSWPGCARTDYAHMLAAAPSAPVAVAQEAAFMDAVACGQGFLMRNADGTEARIPVEDVMQPASPSVDAEKVMGLVGKCKRHWLMAGQQSVYGNHLHAAAEQQAADALLAQIRALLTPATCKSSLQVVGWIPVGERLPETNHPVIGLWWEGTDEGHPEVLYYEGDDVWFDINGMSAAPDYWLPLPPPPAIANQGEE